MKTILNLLGRIVLFCSPFIILTIVYIFSDPYMIIHDYENYNKNFFVNKNRDFVSTEMFIKNSKKYQYDSFIFGSSTSLFIPPSLWNNYIDNKNHIYSFDASRERLAGIWSKIDYLNKNGNKINYALVNIESKTFTEFVNNVPLYMKHPEVYPSSRFYIHYASFLNFCDLRFLFALGHYKLTNHFHQYMSEFLVSESYSYDTVSNEFYNQGILDLFKRDSIAYYEERMDKFPPRSDNRVEETQKINSDQIRMLEDIQEIFSRNNTDYKIIVCPTHNQREFNHRDLLLIQLIFGSENVFDFTGVNRFTEDKAYYYDEFHFKKYLGKELLDSVYSSNEMR